MKVQSKKYEKGFSLIEVVAAFVILMIVLTSFLTFFLTSKKTTNDSKDTMTATYTAQQEMENIYTSIRKTTNDKYPTMMVNLGYKQSCTRVDSQLFTKKIANSNQSILVKLKPNPANNKLTNILINVYDTSKVTLSENCSNTIGTPQAQMENVATPGVSS